MHKKFLLSLFIGFFTLLIPACPLQAQPAKKFTIVLDAGHGGHDPGALGSAAREKDINLAVVKALGKRLEENCPDIAVYYTRKTDVFITLQGRADIVNKHNADLFVCVHTNSAQNTSVAGAETFTLGLTKTQSNLDVAMRENSVMLLEDDYKSRYQGFNPNSVESYIMFEFMQDQYIDRSVQFASAVQQQFTSFAARNNRGVRQAGFWVLHKSACPSVLIELGFITNPREEQYLASAKGQSQMADAIYRAICAYKRDVDKKSGKPVDAAATKPAQTDTQQPTETETEKSQPTTTETDTADGIVYKVQIFSVTQKLPANDPTFRGERNTSYVHENGFYKYMVGNTATFADISTLRKSLLTKFKDAFVVAFRNGEKIPVEEARALQNKK